MIKLVSDTISNNDIDKLVDWLKTYPRLTKGDLTIEFEQKWSEWLGVKHSVYVNSGSSANLLMAYALKYKYKINSVVVPSLSWATDLSPFIQFGIRPHLVDCNLDDLSVDLGELEKIFKEKKPQAFILVSVLGLVPNMDKIVELCDKYNVLLLEDVCESMGSKYKNKKLGTFGLMSSFSFYFGHHISTIEGGMISTNDTELYNLLLMLRSHGWSRDLDITEQAKLSNEWQTDSFSNMYSFYVPGFNLRSTDLQAFIGLIQLEKLDDISRKRNTNFNLYRTLFETKKLWVPKVDNDNFISNFAYPVISNFKHTNITKLQNADIEVRPLIAGSMGTQPFYIKEYSSIDLPYSTIINKQGFYLPNHPDLTIDDIKKICEVII